MDVYVKDSLIHGRGVFAKRPFNVGEVVLPWNRETTRKLMGDEIGALPPEEEAYVVFTESGDTFLILPPARYVNHSCDANTRIKPEGDVAIRPILVDEEITTDYEKEEVRRGSWSMTCGCRAPNCRGTIRVRL